MSENKSIFATLNAINCNEHTEKKNGLTYLSWAWAWAEVKKAYPDSTYTVYENAAGLNYHTDGRTCWVKTGVTIGGIEHIEYLPVMDFRNASIPVDKVTSFDVNKAIQRSLTKACARHGLGLYIYAGEDLPEDEQEAAQKPAQRTTAIKAPAPAERPAESPAKPKLTGAIIKAGKANKIVQYLSAFDPEDFFDYKKGLEAIEAKYDITTDGYNALEFAVRAVRNANTANS